MAYKSVSSADINECLSSNGFCAQQCINTAGSYFCRCNPGFYLDSNGRTCSGKFKCSFSGRRHLPKVANKTSFRLPFLLYINRVAQMSWTRVNVTPSSGKEHKERDVWLLLWIKVKRKEIDNIVYQYLSDTAKSKKVLWQLVIDNRALGIWAHEQCNDLLEWLPNNSFPIRNSKCPQKRSLNQLKPEFQTITSSHFYSLGNAWIDRPLMASSDVTAPLP